MLSPFTFPFCFYTLYARHRRILQPNAKNNFPPEAAASGGIFAAFLRAFLWFSGAFVQISGGGFAELQARAGADALNRFAKSGGAYSRHCAACARRSRPARRTSRAACWRGRLTRLVLSESRKKIRAVSLVALIPKRGGFLRLFFAGESVCRLEPADGGQRRQNVIV